MDIIGNLVSLDEKQSAQFERYYQLLKEWNEKFNLTAITEREDVYLLHFYDSLLVADHIENEATLIDVGTGAGFPGIPLKIARPDLKVTLLEATDKKCHFLKKVIDELKLTEIEVINARAEEYQGHYDYVTARAVASLNILAELCLPLAKTGGHFLAMKGPRGQEELVQAKNAIRKMGGSVQTFRENKLPNGDVRVIIDILKEKDTPKGYPRRYAQIKKKPL